MVAGWESLRVDLLRYGAESPGAVVVGPSPHTKWRHEKRFRIQLAAWATGIAEELHAKYGDLVDLQVGALSFPGMTLRCNEHIFQLPGEPAESSELTVEVLAPLTIGSGRHATQDVLVRNLTAREQTLLTAGDLTSAVTDATGRIVGRYVGVHHLPRIEFPIDPNGSRRVPVLIGTASLVPDLGYAVPPGRWSLVISLHTASGFYLSAPLELAVTG